MRPTHVTVVNCLLAILIGPGARQADRGASSRVGMISMDYTEPVRALAEPVGSRLDSAFIPVEKPYKVKLPTVVARFMAHGENNVHFIDARDPRLYAAGHIPVAVNIPLEMLA